MELLNWLLRFWCTSEELRVVVDRLAEWMANPPPPWDTYCIDGMSPGGAG